MYFTVQPRLLRSRVHLIITHLQVAAFEVDAVQGLAEVGFGSLPILQMQAGTHPHQHAHRSQTCKECA